MTAKKLPKAFFQRLTAYEKADIWSQIENLALDISSCDQNLDTAKSSTKELLNLIKKLERAEIGDILSNKG